MPKFECAFFFLCGARVCGGGCVLEGVSQEGEDSWQESLPQAVAAAALRGNHCGHCGCTNGGAEAELVFKSWKENDDFFLSLPPFPY